MRFLRGHIPGAVSALQVAFNNALSGLVAANVQAALDEMAARVSAIETRTIDPSQVLDTRASYQATIEATADHVMGKINTTVGTTVRINHPRVSKATSIIKIQFTGDDDGGNSTRTDNVRIGNGFFEIYYATATTAFFYWAWEIIRF